MKEEASSAKAAGDKDRQKAAGISIRDLKAEMAQLGTILCMPRQQHAFESRSRVCDLFLPSEACCSMDFVSASVMYGLYGKLSICIFVCVCKEIEVKARLDIYEASLSAFASL